MLIVVGAEKGGVGKTAIATNLAAIAAGDGVDVCLLDTDVQGSSALFAKIRNEAGVTPSIPVYSIPAKPIVELQQMLTKFDLIIVDIGAQNYETMEHTTSIADMILVPTSPDEYELQSTYRVIQSLRMMDARHKNGKVPAYILLNRMSTNAKSKEEEQLREFLLEYEYPVFDSSLRNRSSWKNSRRAGLAVHELTGREADKAATKEMRSIYDEIIRRLKEQQR